MPKVTPKNMSDADEVSTTPPAKKMNQELQDKITAEQNKQNKTLYEKFLGNRIGRGLDALVNNPEARRDLMGLNGDDAKKEREEKINDAARALNNFEGQYSGFIDAGKALKKMLLFTKYLEAKGWSVNVPKGLYNAVKQVCTSKMSPYEEAQLKKLEDADPKKVEQEIDKETQKQKSDPDSVQKDEFETVSDKHDSGQVTLESPSTTTPTAQQEDEVDLEDSGPKLQ